MAPASLLMVVVVWGLCGLATAAPGAREYYRRDGVRMDYDPYAQGMAEKYGAAGETDADGFDPYADSVGAGIYGGRVKRDPRTGAIVIGQQYQNHNPAPGPVYAGGGYTAMSLALQSGPDAVGSLLDRDPSLVNEVSTGGATPLHMCGMGRTNQRSTAYVISRGGACARPLCGAGGCRVPQGWGHRVRGSLGGGGRGGGGLGGGGGLRRVYFLFAEGACDGVAEGLCVLTAGVAGVKGWHQTAERTIYGYEMGRQPR